MPRHVFSKSWHAPSRCEFTTGEFTTGEFSTGEFTTGEFSNGEFSTGEFTTGDDFEKTWRGMSRFLKNVTKQVTILKSTKLEVENRLTVLC